MPKTSTLNAKVAAVGLFLGAITLHALNQIAPDLVPLRLFAIGGLLLGAWAFSDEMGLRKPLNRAAFISFVFAMLALSVTAMETELATGKYYLLYAFALLFAILIWSAAFLHRKEGVKLTGAIGAAASLIPIAILIAGHVSIAAGAFFGVGALMQMSAGVEFLSSTPVKTIEAVFILWAFAAAVLLWRGKIPPSYQTHL